jgi:hypothetical protein
MPEVLPPFSLDGPRYDQSTFSGRLKHIGECIRPVGLYPTRLLTPRAPQSR